LERTHGWLRWAVVRTLGASLLAGRFLTERDENAKRHVVVINQLMAAKYFGGRNPIGQPTAAYGVEDGLGADYEPLV
jgi:hypothetical protein